MIKMFTLILQLNIYPLEKCLIDPNLHYTSLMKVDNRKSKLIIWRQNCLSFEEWLADTCCNPDYSEAERENLLANWAEAPRARYCHPREEHLLPLHVCYGIAQAPCPQYFSLSILNKVSSMYLW